jgi:ATP-dependent exoDNAse (exonuclease V) alpha subunit
MTTAMFGTVVRLGAMKISVAWEDGEERSVSKDIQLAYCMTVHKFQEVRLLMFALSLSTFLRWAFLTVADLLHATRAKGRLRIISAPGIFPVVAAPVAKQKLTNLNFKRT